MYEYTPIPRLRVGVYPLTNVQPFTHHDGETFERLLYRLIRELNKIIGEVNDSNKTLYDQVTEDVNSLIDSVNEKLEEQNENFEETVTNLEQSVAAAISALEQYVNDQVQNIVNNSIELQDTVMSEILADSESESRQELDEILNKYVSIDATGNRYLAVETGEDITEKLQTTIDALRLETIANGYTEPVTLTIPAGSYKISEKISQPTLVRVLAQGVVILETFTENTAWHLTPRADDPTNVSLGKLKKQQWNWGVLLGGSAGTLIFLNGIAPGNTVALELGATGQQGELRPLSRYKLSDIVIQGYDLGVLWNSYNHYICTYERFMIELVNKCVRYAPASPGISVVNSGEKIAWIDSLFASTPLIDVNPISVDTYGHYYETDGINATFYNCSADYLTTLHLFGENSGYCKVGWYGGHIEGINYGTRRVESGGGLVVSRYTKNIFVPEFTIHGTALAQFTRDTLYKGRMIVDIEHDYRNLDNKSITYSDMFQCDSEVTVRKFTQRRWENITFPSEALNLVSAPHMQNDAIGTLVQDIQSLEIVSRSGVNGQVSDHAGKKCLTLRIGVGGSISLANKALIPVKPGESVVGAIAFWRPLGVDSLNIAYRYYFYNAEGEEIASQAAFAPPLGSAYEKWVFGVNGRVSPTAPIGATHCKLRVDISSANGTADQSVALTGLTVTK